MIKDTHIFVLLRASSLCMLLLQTTPRIACGFDLGQTTRILRGRSFGLRLPGGLVEKLRREVGAIRPCDRFKLRMYGVRPIKLSPALPDSRVSATVKYREDNQLIRTNAEVH